MSDRDNLVVTGEEAKIVKKRLGYGRSLSCENCISSTLKENKVGGKELFCEKSFGFHFFTNSDYHCDFHAVRPVAGDPMDSGD